MALKSYLIDNELIGMYLSSTHEVTDKEGNITTNRLVEGDSELNIKKQSPTATPKIIYIGSKVFSTSDVTVQKFLESKPYFGTKIKEYDPVKINTEKLDAKRKSINVLKEVIALDRKEIFEVGYVLFGRKALNYIKNNDINGLHGEIIDLAGNEPEKVDNILNNADNKDTLFAGFLIASGVFEVSIDDRFVTWADNGSTVYAVPNGVSAVEGLVEYFKTTEGREVKKEASLRLEAKATKKTVSAKKAVAKSETKSETTETTPEV